ncbi:hypothetical protein K431DRAFT_349051 [Polychaeton citri CBS 116435]|uniref:PH domain-containing protein n=1 Tax=Polychaeton citri CBS 116435 TaxID=1314669 RepID=A0A9P4Q209_9PEZI|nr:hypothetical protein K431DRAFT_349051 [Polychaeton citri CBS 116435]
MASMARTPKNGGGGGGSDPFTSGSPSRSSNHTPSGGPLRYAAFDQEQFSFYSNTHSPSHAKRALEAHLKDTDRRIQDASRLGTTLVQQRKDLAARLKEVEQLAHDTENGEQIPEELQQRLIDLEREYNEIGRESARAFLPKTTSTSASTSGRVVGEQLDPNVRTSVLSGSAKDSPSKVSAPSSRRQRNQPVNRVHDIEFAAEISTSLLAQVRQLQAALTDKDESLKEVSAEKARLEADASSMIYKIRQLDESEQRYKDANWELETRLQDLEATHREVTDKEQRQGNTLKSSEARMALAIRELEELKSTHARALEDHVLLSRQQEADLNTLRRDAAAHDAERDRLQKHIDEVKSQNAELAKAVAANWRSQSRQEADRELVAADEGGTLSGSESDDAEFGQASTTKGTPARNGMLESETLKSSLNHAHRMIQNLKNNIHREKTEKIELRRMLTEARDELETSRRDSNGGIAQQPNTGRKRAANRDSDKFKKPDRPGRLGATRSSNVEILEDEPDWEDDVAGGLDNERTPSKVTRSSAHTSTGLSRAFDHRPAYARMDTTDSEAAGFQTANETQGFETANDEREGITTETDAFHTGAESLAGEDDSSDDLTETEGTVNRSQPTIASKIGKTPSPLVSAKPGDRTSFMSTASTSADEEDYEDDDDMANVRTPQQNHGQPRYRLRVSRGGASRKSRGSSALFLDSPTQLLQSPNAGSVDSPASSSRTDRDTPSAKGGRQTLGDELEGLDDESLEGTPSTLRYGSMEPEDLKNDDGAMPLTPTKVANVEQVHAQNEEASLGSPLAISSPVVADRFIQDDSKTSLVAAPVGKEVVRPTMVDAGMMTEPWEPEKVVEVVKKEESLAHKTAEVVSGALAGFGLGKLAETRGHEAEGEQEAQLAASEGESDIGDDNVKGAGLFTPQQATTRAAIQGQTFTSTRDVLASDIPANKQEEPTAIPATETVHQQPLEFADIVSLDTEPVQPEQDLPPSRPVTAEKSVEPSTAEFAAAAVPFAPAQPLSVAKEVKAEEPQQLGFSSVVFEELEPMQAHQPASSQRASYAVPLVPKRSSRRLDQLFVDGEEAPREAIDAEDKDAARPQDSDLGKGFFASFMPPPLKRNRSKSVPSRPQDEMKDPLEPNLVKGSKGPSGIPILSFGDDSMDDYNWGNEKQDAETVRDSNNVDRAIVGKPDSPQQQHKYSDSNASMLPMTKPLQIKKPLIDDGVQTMLSGADIESLIRSMGNSRPSTAIPAPVPVLIPSSTSSPGSRSPRRSAELATVDEASKLAIKRPTSAGSNRSRALEAPPLPPDHSQKIAAAQKTPAPVVPPAGTMGPPIMPASAYKKRPTTPNLNARPATKDSTTPRPPRASMSNSERPSNKSRTTSISSFASEVDERIRPSQGVLYPDDIQPSTDPRMIQAITQTMIGEFLWKYTRKAGRSEISNSRHRRFFWIHPYTRTLYWSEHDPSTMGRDMMKAKSVAIQSVRVITDDNAYPPGLHRKSLVVVTPGRDIIFTAPTGQRHETWFNALSYLLLRTEREKAEAEDEVNEEDLEDFNPNGSGGIIGRSISRMTGRSARSRSRTSLSSYNSRTTRASSPHMYSSLAHRQSQAHQRGSGTVRGWRDGSRDRSNDATITSRTASTNRDGASPSSTAIAAAAAAAAFNGDSPVQTLSQQQQQQLLQAPNRQQQQQGSTSGRLSSLTSAFRAPSRTQGSFSGRKGANSALSNRSAASGSAADTGIYDASVVGESAEDLRQVIEQQERDAMDRLEDVRACCDGKHNVGSLPRNSRHASFGSRFGGSGHGHHHHSHVTAEPIKESQRPRRGE